MSYHLWEEDIKLLQQYGARSYRFSISWSRIRPLGGKGAPINEQGVAYYNDLVGLITPFILFVTLSLVSQYVLTGNVL